MFTNLSFKHFFITLTIIFLILSLFIFSNQIFASQYQDCTNCNTKVSLRNNGDGFTNEELEKMRTTISENDLSYSIGNTKISKYALKQVCGLKKPINSVNSSNNSVNSGANNPIETSSVAEKLPASYDLRAKGLTPIKYQGSCGSCWAFAVVGTIENVIKIADNKTLDLSEQWTLDCNSTNYGCNGGWWTFDMYVKNGSVYESDLPYKGIKNSCRTSLSYHEKITSWDYVDANYNFTPSTNQLKQAILTYGPLTTGMYCDESSQAYKAGLYSAPNSEINHAVVLVGWDDNRGAWIVRNSWGTDWGENGYVYVKYGSSSIGVGTAYVKYTSAKNDSSKNDSSKDITPYNPIFPIGF